MDTENPLSSAIPNSLAVTVLSDSEDSEDVGFVNTGYFGISPDEGKFRTGFYMKGDYQGSITINLLANSNNYIDGRVSLSVNSTASEFRYFESLLPAERAEPGPAHWKLTLDEPLIAGETFYFDLIQLWEPQYKNRLVFPSFQAVHAD